MGREVRRVPLDFDWPLKKVWDGFLNPHYQKCRTCGGDGSTPHGRYLDEVAGMIALGGSYPDGHPFMHCAPPGARWAELSGALSRPPRPPLGHDSIDRWSVAKAIRKAAGLPKHWGWCEVCNGDGIAPEAQAAYEAWTETPPPEGEGWQMWETTSEGSPISPVFETPEALARWLADTGASTFGSMTTTYEAWLRMICGPGWSPSMIVEGGQMMSGVDAMSKEEP